MYYLDLKDIVIVSVNTLSVCARKLVEFHRKFRFIFLSFVGITISIIIEHLVPTDCYGFNPTLFIMALKFLFRILRAKT